LVKENWYVWARSPQSVVEDEVSENRYETWQSTMADVHRAEATVIVACDALLTMYPKMSWVSAKLNK
jgi:hypothetical protein